MVQADRFLTQSACNHIILYMTSWLVPAVSVANQKP